MSTDRDNRDRVQQILWEALKLSGEARSTYLEMACGGDSELRGEIESLLEAESQAGRFLCSQDPEPNVVLAEKVGDRIGRYKLLEQIGEGGFGVVWMAEQEEPVRRRIALKIIKLGMDTREVVGRFEAERQALAMMEHPNIARVFDGGATDTGRPYFVMELVKGLAVTEYCNLKRLTTQQRLELFRPICEAVQHAHAKGIIHRDLKPSNILVSVLDDMPVPKVIDFGVAKATQTRLTEQTLITRFQQWVGTPAYMSPEQAGLGRMEVDARADVYALGVLLYELLTGKTPFDTQKLQQAGLEAVLRTIRDEEPPKPSTRLSTLSSDDLERVSLQRQTKSSKLSATIQGELDWMVMKALEKDRQRRYQSVKELGLDLQRYLENKPVSAGAPSRLYRFHKYALRHRSGLGLAAGFVVGYLVLNVVVGMLLAAVRSPPPGLTLKASFRNVGGLVPLDPILLHNKKVGCVERIAFDPASRMTWVSLRVFTHYSDQIHTDSKVSIRWPNDARSGRRRVGFDVVVEPGTPGAPRAQPGSVLLVDERNFTGSDSKTAAGATANSVTSPDDK